MFLALYFSTHFLCVLFLRLYKILIQHYSMLKKESTRIGGGPSPKASVTLQQGKIYCQKEGYPSLWGASQQACLSQPHSPEPLIADQQKEDSHTPPKRIKIDPRISLGEEQRHKTISYQQSQKMSQRDIAQLPLGARGGQGRVGWVCVLASQKQGPPHHCVRDRGTETERRGREGKGEERGSTIHLEDKSLGCWGTHISTHPVSSPVNH